MCYARYLCAGVCAAFLFRELWASGFLDPYVWLACVAFGGTLVLPREAAAKATGRAHYGNQ